MLCFKLWANQFLPPDIKGHFWTEVEILVLFMLIWIITVVVIFWGKKEWEGKTEESVSLQGSHWLRRISMYCLQVYCNESSMKWVNEDHEDGKRFHNTTIKVICSSLSHVSPKVHDLSQFFSLSVEHEKSSQFYFFVLLLTLLQTLVVWG